MPVDSPSGTFREFLRTVARGPTLSRTLSAAEAEEALGLILDGQALPMQVGAFLLVLRQRGETAEELTGMARAARSRAAIRAFPAADWDITLCGFSWPRRSSSPRLEFE